MRWNARILAIMFGVCGLASPSALAQPICYVDIDRPTGGDGTSWTDAFKYLQDAIAQVYADNTANPGTWTAIHVAQGTYHPDDTEADPNSGDRTARFHSLKHVELYGGYAGYGEPDPDDRDPAAYVTILSGDLEDNDPTDPTENSYTVVVGYEPDDSTPVDDTAVVDGFTITGG